MHSKRVSRAVVGLEYEAESPSAPTLSVKAENWAADEILKLARRFSIPIVEKPALVRSLKTLDLDQEIPESLYRTVALLIHELDRR